MQVAGVFKASAVAALTVKLCECTDGAPPPTTTGEPFSNVSLTLVLIAPQAQDLKYTAALVAVAADFNASGVTVSSVKL